MGMFWVRLGMGAFAAFSFTTASPAVAAEQEAGQVMAQQLTERTREPESDSDGAEDKLSDSAVRVMTSYAWSIMPNQVEGPAGMTIRLDKSDPAKIIIPVDDARTVIRAAMRSAYADICDLPELGRKNFRTLMDRQEDRGVWTVEQIQFINTLHMFAVSYFTGDMKITEQDETGAPADEAASKATEGEDAFNPTRPTCTPEKKEAVTQAIQEYLQAAETTQAPPANTQAPAASNQAPAASNQAPAASAPAPSATAVPPSGAPLAQPVSPDASGAN